MKTIIKHYKDELNELLSHHKVEDIYNIANVHDRTQAIAYEEFIEKLSERQKTIEANKKADTKQLIIGDVIKSACKHPIEYQCKDDKGFEACSLCGERL